MTRLAAAQLLLVAALAPGCRFDPAGASLGDDDVPPADADPLAPDADALTVDGGALADAAPIDAGQVAFCDPADPDLRGCWRFENLAPGNVALDDESGSNNDGTALDVGVGVGPVGHGDALAFKPLSSASVADDSSLDLAGALTLELWINPSTYPDFGARYGLVDKNAQWGLFFSDQGRPRCTRGGASVEGSVIALDRWTHVACVYDMTAATWTVYVDGEQAGMVNSTATIDNRDDALTFGEDSPGGGDQFDGLIDDVRVFASPRSAAQLCAAAAPNCTP